MLSYLACDRESAPMDVRQDETGKCWLAKPKSLANLVPDVVWTLIHLKILPFGHAASVLPRPRPAPGETSNPWVFTIAYPAYTSARKGINLEQHAFGRIGHAASVLPGITAAGSRQAHEPFHMFSLFQQLALFVSCLPYLQLSSPLHSVLSSGRSQSRLIVFRPALPGAFYFARTSSFP